MRIGLITYDAPHLKTEQVALALASRRHALHFFALPFVARPSRAPLFKHRPDQNSAPETSEIADYLGCKYTPVASPSQIWTTGFDYYIIAGAGLLPRDFVASTRGKVINSHPGVIPVSRGLDSFKWSIVDGLPLGNTLHFIDEEADAGEVLTISPTPVFTSDTLETLARRHYEREIDMLSSFEQFLGKARPASSIGHPRPARMRMPKDQEVHLEEAFVRYKAERATAEVKMKLQQKNEIQN
jgi:phosphoribosylglycinamide formyltransferase-1